MTYAEKRERRRQIAGAIDAGEVIADVAVRFEVTTSTVAIACREHGVPLPVVVRRRDISSLEIVADLLAGRRPRDIVRERGVSKQYVSQIYQKCLEAGIKISQGGK